MNCLIVVWVEIKVNYQINAKINIDDSIFHMLSKLIQDLSKDIDKYLATQNLSLTKLYSYIENIKTELDTFIEIEKTNTRSGSIAQIK